MSQSTSPTESQTPGNDFLAKAGALFNPTTQDPIEPKEPTPEVTPEVTGEATGEDTGEVTPEAALAEDWRSPKAAQWKELKQQRDEAARKAEEFEQRFKEFELRVKATEGLQEERDRLAKELEAVAIERSPAFKERFDGPIRKLKERIGGLAGGKAGEVLAAGDLDQLEAALEGVGPARAGNIMNQWVELQDLLQGRQQALDENREQWIQGQEAALAQAKAQEEKRMGQLREVFDEKVRAWQDPVKGFDLLRLKGDEKHDAAVRERLARTEAVFFGDLEPAQLMQAAGWIATGPDLAKEVVRLRERLAELEPPSPGGGSGVAQGAGGSQRAGESPLESIRRQAREAGLA